MKKHGHEPVKFLDVKDEIFDMVKPADPYKITLQDLINRSDITRALLKSLTELFNYLCLWLYSLRVKLSLLL